MSRRIVLLLLLRKNRIAFVRSLKKFILIYIILFAGAEEKFCDATAAGGGRM